MSLKSVFSCLSLLAVSAISAAAQTPSVPISFAGTLAGGGTVCSTGIPVFSFGAVAGANYGDGCPATQATLNVPVAATADQYGNVFIADQTNQLVRVVYNGGSALATAITAANVLTPNIVPQKGYIYTIAGGETKNAGATYCSQMGSGAKGVNAAQDSCPGTETEEGPRGLAVDADGNLFIASVSPVSEIRVFYVGGSAAANLIKLENPSVATPLPGYVYLIAGGNASAYGGDGALAYKATMNTPRGLTIDANENVYFADQLNQVVRRIDSSSGFISTIAGHCVASGTNCTATATSGDGGGATVAAVNIENPYSVALDQSGNIFIAEGGATGVPGRVRVVYEGGTLPGISSPTIGNIYTYAGGASGTAGTSPAQTTIFQLVYGISFDPAGYLYVTDYRNGSTGSNHIWRVDPTNGNTYAIAGNGASALTSGASCNGLGTGPVATDTRGDGCPATQAYLNLPQESFTWTPGGTFYIADRGNNVVRSFTFNNLFPATAIGSSATQPLAFLFQAAAVPTTESFTNQGVTSTEYADAGGATCALNTALAATTTCVYPVKFMPANVGARPGSITVSGATGTLGTQTLLGVGAGPVLAIDPGTSGTLGSGLSATSVTADENGSIYVSDTTSKSVLKGTTTLTTLTQLNDAPGQTTIDPFGDVFVADPGSNKVVEVLSAAKGGATTTFGTGLSGPQGVAADQFGNVFVADTGDNRIVSLSPATGNQVVVPISGFTLNAPTQLATDSAGDLFLVDSGNSRIIELPMGASPLVLTLPSGTVPTSVALDAGGDLYIADKTTGSVLYLPAGATVATGLVTGLKAPVSVAVAPSGAVYVADTSASSIIVDNRAVNTSAFTTTNIQLTSLPITLTVDNIGNTSGALATPPFVETGTASAFPATGSGTTCAAGSVLAVGGSCTQSFVFQPTTPGAQSAKIVFSTTTGRTATANFTATATNLIFTTTTLTLTNTGPISYGQLANYTVTLTPQSNGSAAPTGSISILVNGTAVATAKVSSNPYTFQLALPVGTDTVAAVYTGDAVYAGSNVSTVVTVSKAPTTTTVSSTQTASGIVLAAIVTPASTGAMAPSGTVAFYVDGKLQVTLPFGTGTVSTTVLLADGSHSFYAAYSGDANYSNSQSATQNLTIARTPTTLTLSVTSNSANGTTSFVLSAKISASGTGTPTGTITFYNGTTAVGTVNLTSAVNGVVSFTPTASATSYTFSASYSGDGLFQPSTATATPSFFVTTPAAASYVIEGGQAVATVTVTAIEGYTGTVTASCMNLPANSLCRFTPASVAIGSTGTATTQLQFFAGVNPAVASMDTPSSPVDRNAVVFTAFLLAPLALAFRRRKAAYTVLFALALLSVTATLTGCGNKTPAVSTGTFVTPQGTYTPTIVMTDTNGIAGTSTFTITVAPAPGQ